MSSTSMPIGGVADGEPFAVSVIVATKNAERFLAECLNSVWGQTLAPQEVIVVDADSNDASAAIAETFPATRVLRQTGRGLWQAWNQGIDDAAGSHIAIIDSDDVWAPDALESLRAGLAGNPETRVSIGRVRFFLGSGHPPKGFRTELLHGDRRGHLQGCALVRRDLYDEIGCYDESWQFASDIAWFHNLRTSGQPIAYVDRVVLSKRIHESNLSSTFDYGPDVVRIARESLLRRRAGAG